MVLPQSIAGALATMGCLTLLLWFAARHVRSALSRLSKITANKLS